MNDTEKKVEIALVAVREALNALRGQQVRHDYPALFCSNRECPDPKCVESRTPQRHEHAQIQHIGGARQPFTPDPYCTSHTRCAYCEKPLERGFVARVLLDDGKRQAHVECHQGRRSSTMTRQEGNGG